MTWLRERMKIFIWITAIAFIVPFVAGTLIRNFMGPQAPRGTLATVNEQEVSVESYQDLYDQLREQRTDQQQEPLTSDELDELRQEAFKQTINRTLMQQALQREGAQASESEIRQMFAQNPTFRTEDGQIDRRAVQRTLSQMPDERRKQIERSSRRRIESLRMSQWLATQVNTTDSEARLLMREGLRELNLYGIYINPRTMVDRSRIRTFYEKRKDEFRKPPEAFVRHILFESDTQTRQPRSRLNEIKEKIQTIRRRFKAGDSFEELARQFSDDEKTAKNGGALGWVSPDDLEQPFANEVFGGDTGTLSSLIRTDRGYHIAYVEKGPRQTYEKFSQVAEQIQKRLLSDTHWVQAREKINSIRSRLTNSSSPLKELQETALVESNSPFAADRAGHYGWVPTSFVLQSQHPNAAQWGEELLNQNTIRQEISETLSELKPEEVSDIVRTDRGFHVFMASNVQSSELSTLSDTDTLTVRRQLDTRKKSNYRNAWLKKKRKEASIELIVPKSRIGGKIPWEDEKKES